jgi:hypothetical protein
VGATGGKGARGQAKDVRIINYINIGLAVRSDNDTRPRKETTRASERASKHEHSP